MLNKLRTKINSLIDSVPSEYKSANTSTDTNNTDIIHKIILNKIIDICHDAGLKIKFCEIGPHNGCDHTHCKVKLEVFIPLVEMDKMGQEQDMVMSCIKSTILIAFSEVLGASKLVDENYIINKL